MRIGRLVAALVALVAAAAAMVVDAPVTSADELPVNCQDGYPIGGTAYITWNGRWYSDAGPGSITVASVKQYYSPRCRANWSYVYVWESFRNLGYGWNTRAWISDRQGRGYGISPWRKGWIHTYSVPAGTVSLCTHAAAEIVISRSTIDLKFASRSTSTNFQPTGC